MVDCRLSRNKKSRRCIVLKSIQKKPLRLLNWKESKSKFPKLSPCGDVDRDGVKNSKDCKPFNKRKHIETPQFPLFGEDLYVCPKIIKAVDIIRYGKEIGLKPLETHRELQKKGYTGDEERRATILYRQTLMGLNLVDYEGAC